MSVAGKRRGHVAGMATWPLSFDVCVGLLVVAKRVDRDFKSGGSSTNAAHRCPFALSHPAAGQIGWDQFECARRTPNTQAGFRCRRCVGGRGCLFAGDADRRRDVDLAGGDLRFGLLPLCLASQVASAGCFALGLLGGGDLLVAGDALPPLLLLQLGHRYGLLGSLLLQKLLLLSGELLHQDLLLGGG